MSKGETVDSEAQNFEVCADEILASYTRFSIDCLAESAPIPAGKKGTSIIDLYGDETFTVQGADGVKYVICGRGAIEGKGTTKRIDLHKGERAIIQGCDGVEYAAEGQGGPAWLTGLTCAIWTFIGWFTVGHFWPSPW